MGEEWRERSVGKRERGEREIGVERERGSEREITWR